MIERRWVNPAGDLFLCHKGIVWKPGDDETPEALRAYVQMIDEEAGDLHAQRIHAIGIPADTELVTEFEYATATDVESGDYVCVAETRSVAEAKVRTHLLALRQRAEEMLSLKP